MDYSLGLRVTKIFLDLMEEWKGEDESNSQAKLGKMMEMEPSMINHFKNGIRILGLHHWEEAAGVFKVPLEIFILGDPNLTPKQNRQIVERLLEQRRLLVKDILT